MIYLDNAATTLKKPPCVAEAVVRAMATMGNSGRSAHQEALDASRVIYRTREQLARLLGCSAAERVVFTCNSTEALNIAIDGLFAPGDHVLSTDCEHNSVLRPLYRLEGVEVDFLPADRRGCIDYDDFRRLLRPNTRGIVCTHGSNLTGNLLDIRAIGRFAKEHGLLLVVDASQTAGVFDIDMEAMGIDVVCFTGHKSLLGPQGTGGLCIAPGWTSPLQGGRHRCADVSAPAAAPSTPPGWRPAPSTATASPGCRRRWTIWRRRGWRPSAATSRRWPGSFTKGCPSSPASPYTATSPHGTGRRWCL